MKALIAEDEPHLAEDLRRRLARLWPELEIVVLAHDGHAAIEALAGLRPDIAFLDIRMPGPNGLDVAATAAPGCRIVFVTAYDDHAVRAFDQAAADYLLKPVSDERLARCVERLRRQSGTAPDALLARLRQLLAGHDRPEPLRWLKAQVGQNVHLVAVDEVCYFQSADKYTTVATRDAELLLRTPLRELIARLDPAEFWQVHRGTVVNVRLIAAAHHDLLGKVSLSLKNRPEKLAVSRTYAHLFRQM